MAAPPIITQVQTVSGGIDVIDGAEQTKCGYAQGLYWSWALDVNAYVSYTTSPDNVTWSAVTEVYNQGSFAAEKWSVYMTPSLVAFVTMTVTHGQFVWRYGIPNPDGTINWLIAATTVSTTNPGLIQYPYILIDAAGNFWLALSERDNVPNHFVDVYTSTGGTWTNILNTAVVHDQGVHLVSLTGGPGIIAFIYTDTVVGTVTIQGYNGSSWTSTASPASPTSNFNFNATAIGQTVHYIGFANGTTVIYWNATYPFPTTPVETTFNSNGYGNVGIQTDGTNLVAFYAVAGTILVYRTNLKGAGWGAETVLFLTPNTKWVNYNSNTTHYMTPQGTPFFEIRDSTANTSGIYFATFSPISVASPPSYVAGSGRTPMGSVPVEY